MPHNQQVTLTLHPFVLITAVYFSHLELATQGTNFMSLRCVTGMASGASDRLLALLLLRMW